MKKLNERLLTAPDTKFRSASLKVSPKYKNDKQTQNPPQKIKDLLKMMKEPPKLNFDNSRINQMCQVFPEYMEQAFNKYADIKGGTNATDYQEYLQKLQMDSFDDMKIPIESNEEQMLNNQFHYLYVNIPSYSNKHQYNLNDRGTVSTANSALNSARRKCFTPNQLSARSTARSFEDTLRQTKNANKTNNVQFYDSQINNRIQSRGDFIKVRDFSNSFNNSRYYRANSAQESANESLLQKTQNSFIINKPTDISCNRNITTSQSRRSKYSHLEGRKLRNELVNTSSNNFYGVNTQGIDQQNSPSNKNKSFQIQEQGDYSTKFITEPSDINFRPSTSMNKNFYEQKTNNSGFQFNNCNMRVQNNFINQNVNDPMNDQFLAQDQIRNDTFVPNLINIKKREKKEVAEWKYIEFVHERKSLSMQPDSQKVNSIIKKVQLNQIPKNCSLNSQIERSQLQRYFDQFLITSKPATPTKIKEIRQRLAVSKDILREQGLQNDVSRNPVKKKINQILQKSNQDLQSFSSPSFVKNENFDDPAFFLKNRLSPSKINYKEKIQNIDEMEDAIPEVFDEDNYVETTPNKMNSSPDFQNDKKTFTKLEEIANCSSSEEEEEVEEEDLQIYKENSDDEYDENDLEEKQKKLEILKQRKARRSKNIKFWEKSAKESFVKSPENDKKSYLRNTISSQKQKRMIEDIEGETNQKKINTEQKQALTQVNNILNACQKVKRQNKIDNKIFKKAHNEVNKNINKFVDFLPKGEEEEDNFEQDIKEIIRDQKLHDFLQKQMIIDYEDSIQQLKANRTQNQQIKDLSRPKEIITFVKNNILDSVIRNPAFYNHLLTDTRKKRLQEDKIKIKSYVNQQDKDMSKLVKYSDFISFK
ncbi:hypothetical protein TTHERM_00022800 (macronuclear) [Tetrahymena thermophila SB210]|uniref:Uncharacterized protein n=1 Tax=Tetrahymena thermophila (strain SB210) TaxID=312017 RepID=Q22RA2_TETTS|nr:hypothetical protein TTHERM_00022800 [Tetrahymena thermophila SB210]EAR88220.2 hypothetical protein TTHERM_00022800 [Tetrahymena thermophila SB210]|eukprot:XP_001008465.2 hypothetical protein TTHERM_00022800 [Tetrahymena thermophila SB210]